MIKSCEELYGDVYFDSGFLLTDLQDSGGDERAA